MEKPRLYYTDGKVATPRPDTFLLFPKILNGGIAGICALCVIFPLDLVKTRLQNQKPGPSGELMYKSIADCFRKTLKSEGILGMYSGVMINMLLVTPEKAIKMAANDLFRYHLTEPSGRLTLPNQMLAGGGAGFFQMLITTPMELLKIRMQDYGRLKAMGKNVENVTTVQLITNLVKERGLFGFYKGIFPTMLRDVGFAVIYFPMFAILNAMGPRMADGSGDPAFWVSCLAGLASGTVSAVAVTPFDVLKTRIQAKECNDGIMPCFYNTLRREGILAFFKGGACRVMVLAPTYGIIQVIYYYGIGEWILGVKKDRLIK